MVVQYGSSGLNSVNSPCSLLLAVSKGKKTVIAVMLPLKTKHRKWLIHLKLFPHHHTQILNIKLWNLLLLHFISTHHCTCHSMNQRLVGQEADSRAAVVGHLCSFYRSRPAKHRKVTAERSEGRQLVVGPVFQAAGMVEELQIFTATTPLCFQAQRQPKRESDEDRNLSRNASS